ncbi:MAG: ATP-binding protein [Thermodesulfobacteriota bacterium]
MRLQPEILIVDDKKANLVALQNTLKDINGDIIQASSGDEALRATLDHDFALAILDVNMPNMDGYELAEILHTDTRTRFLPIIFLTAVRMEETDIFKGYEAGGVDYILKPYNPRILLGKVQVFLQLNHQRRLLRLQQEQLKNINDELEAFTYSVSHDLQAPLRAISSYSDTLLKEHASTLKGDGKSYLEYIQESADDMSCLIDDLLQLSRSTSGNMEVTEVNLSLLANSVATELQRRDPERRVTLSITEDLMAHADPGLMRRALENLLGNAWKFTTKCDKPHIEFGRRQLQGEAPVYFVKDNGAGFDMAYAEKLFSPFERLHSKNDFPGTGIGLATVQRIIRRHGGKVWGESEPDKGATFFFQLDAEASPGEIIDDTAG